MEIILNGENASICYANVTVNVIFWREIYVFFFFFVLNLYFYNFRIMTWLLSSDDNV